MTVPKGYLDFNPSTPVVACAKCGAVVIASLTMLHDAQAHKVVPLGTPPIAPPARPSNPPLAPYPQPPVIWSDTESGGHISQSVADDKVHEQYFRSRGYEGSWPPQPGDKLPPMLSTMYDEL